MHLFLVQLAPQTCRGPVGNLWARLDRNLEEELEEEELEEEEEEEEELAGSGSVLRL